MEANDASLGSGDATARAQELRASLGARQDAETLLAEAGRIRQDAASAADALVEEAQQLSAQLVAESRGRAEQVDAEARERADGVLARARIEAGDVTERARATADAIRAAAEADIEEHRRRVRAEVTAQVTRDLTEEHRRAEAGAREQSEALISDLEASVRILGVSLESAMANVSELLGSLEALRSTSDPAPAMSDLWPEPTAGGQHLDDSAYAGGQTAAPATSVPSATSQFGTEQPDDESADTDATDETPDPGENEDSGDTGDNGGDPDRPRSATEAFLSSSSLEVEQSSRELRDLQHPEEARRRRSEESRLAAQRRELEEGLADGGAGEGDEPDPAEGSRPLGWLFRSAH